MRISYKSVLMLAVWLVTIVSGVLSVYLIANLASIKKMAIEDKVQQVDKEAKLSADDINSRLLYVMQLGRDLADNISNGKIAYNTIEGYSKSLMVDNHNMNLDKPTRIYNLGVSFAKGAFDKNKPEQLANWIHISNKDLGEITTIHRTYDYTVDDGTEKTKWFARAVSERKAFWQQPKFGDVSDKFLVAYTIPFYDTHDKNKVIGTVSIGFSTEELRAILSRQDYRKSGYGIVLSDEGKLIYHPNDLLPMMELSQFSNGFDADFSSLQAIKAVGDTPFVELGEGDDKKWVITKKVESTSWVYKVVFFESELGIDQKTIVIRLQLISALTLFFVFLFFLMRGKNNSSRGWWLFSIKISIVFIIGTALLWKIADIKELSLSQGEFWLGSDADVGTYKKEQEAFYKAKHAPPPKYIATGFYLSSAEFQAANNIVVSGYVWEKLILDSSYKSNQVPDDFCQLETAKIPKNKDLLLIDAFSDIDNAQLVCEKSNYMVAKDNVVTVGWYFRSQLRQPFSYLDYPLDKNVIWLRLKPVDLDGGVVLTPDFNGYYKINPKALMGVDLTDFVLPGWKVFSSFFTVKTTKLNANFGNQKVSQQYGQDLMFNLAIKRNFFDALFSTVIPIIIIYIILFVVLFSSLDILLDVLAINAGLLFSVVIWHSSLRSDLASSGITYFETFYFVCYFVISLVCVNTVLISSNYQITWLQYKNNLVAKLVFMPLVTFVTLILTYVMLFIK